MVNQSTNSSALRIIDASFNRAMEGLRVVEEYARMHLNDSFLAEQAKQLRHQLATVISQAFAAEPIIHRDILHDVGTAIKTDTEYQRSDLNQILRASAARTLQSLRSMEEYSKLIRPEVSPKLESIRYRVYALEKALVGTARAQAALADARLYVLTDSCSDISQLEVLVQQLVAGGVDLIQLRDKNLDDRELVAAGAVLSRLTRDTAAKWIMNDRADLAVVCQADGVHVGQNDLGVAEARRIVGSNRIVGASTHNFEQATDAVMQGADYIGMGPAFQSNTKSFEKFAESEFIQRVASEISLPAFAIGGIDFENLDQLMKLGVSRIAISNSIIAADDPSEAAEQLKAKLVF